MPGLPTRIPVAFEVVLPGPGQPGGPGGPGGPPPPSPGAGWEVFVYAAPAYSTLLCQIPQYMSLQFSKVLKDKGAGTIVVDLDMPWFATTRLGNNQLASTLFDDEHLWVVTQDGVRRFEFLAETVTEQLVDGSEQRTATVTGPGTMQCLTWAAAMPPGFPNIIFKTDAIQDGFAEIDQNGNLQVDTSIWNVIQPASAVSLNPSGTLQLVAGRATTYCGATAYNITSSLISAQITPIGGGSNTGLDGSQLTQFYIQDTKNTNNYALIGLSATGLYCQVGDTVAGTNLTKPLGAYDPTSQLYWQISEKNGSFYFWTSPDGVTYSQEWVVPYKWSATKVTVYFAAKYDLDNSQVMAVTNINGNVVTPSSSGNIFFGEPIMGVWHDLLTAAQSRGTVPFLTTQLSDTADSFGNPWTDSNSVQIQNGTDLWSLLQSHAAIVNADYIMQPGFLLQVGIPVTGGVSLGTDRSQQIIIRESGAEVSKSRVRDRSAIENSVGAVNSDGTTLSASDPASIATWGQREGWVQTAVQVNPASIEIAATASIEETRDQKLSWTLSVIPDSPRSAVFRDYDVGDWVGLERPGLLLSGGPAPVPSIDAIRVIAAAISIDATGQVTCELTVNSYLQWLQEQLQYLVNKMGGQFINSLGTTPVTSNASGPTQLPTIFSPNLGGMNDTLTAGVQHGAPLLYNAVTGTWQPAATANTENSDLTPVIVQTPGGSVTIQPDPVLPPVVTTTDGQGNSVITTPTSHTVQGPTGQKVVMLPYAAQVVDATGTTRAVVGAQPDGTVTVTTQNTPTPASPDTPSVAGGPLGVYVGWDGLLGGTGPLQDFDHIEVHVSPASSFTPSSATLQGQMVAGGLYGVGGLASGTTYFARLVAVSKSGARSAPSGQASAVPTGIATTPITGSQIANGTITSAQISAVAGILGSQLSGSAGITGGQVSFTAKQIGGITTTVSSTAPVSPATGDLWFDGTNGYQLKVWSGTAWTPFQYGTNAISAGSITAALISANTITATQIAAGTITATQIAAGTITATQITAGTIDSDLLAAGIVVSGIIDGTVVTGTTVQNSSTNPQTSINPDGSFTITDAAGTVIFEIDPAGNVSWFGQSGQLQVTISNNGDYLIYQAPQGPDEWLFEPPAIPLIIASGASAVSTTAYTIPVTVPSAGGAAVTVCASSSGPDAPTKVTDSNGNNYIQIASTVTGKYLELWQAQNCSALNTTDTFTITYAAANTDTKNFIAVSAPGVPTTGALDAVNSAGGTSAAPAVSCTPSTVNDLLLLFVTNASGGGNPVNPADGWIRLGQVVATGEPYTTVWYSTNNLAALVTGAVSITSAAWGAAIAALTPATGTPPASTGFAGNNASLSQSTIWSFDGDFSLKVTQSGTQIPWGATSPRFAVSPGQPVTMQAELYTPGALTALTAGFNWFDVNGALVGSAAGDQGSFSTTAGEQLQVTITAAIAPAAAVSASFFVQQGAGTGNNTVFSSDAATGSEGSLVRKPSTGTHRRVGVMLGNSTSNGDNTIAQFNSAVGSGFLHALHAFYQGNIPSSISAAPNVAPGFSLSSAVGAYRVLIDFELTHYGSTTSSGVANTFVLGSGSNVIPSACVTEHGKLDTFIGSCIAAGLDLRITLWHEPFSKFNSSAIPSGTNPATGKAWTQQQADILDYTNSVGYMGQVLRKYNIPVHFDPTNYSAQHDFATMIGSASAPGMGWSACSKGFIDEIMSDFYVNQLNSSSTPAGSGVQGTLDAVAGLADAFGLPLGFCELGFAPANGGPASTGGVLWNGKDVDAFSSYVLNFLSTRNAAGKPISDIIIWATNDNVTATGMYLATNWANTGSPAFGSANTIPRYRTISSTYDNGTYALRHVATDFEPGIEVRQDPVTDPERQPGDYDPGTGPAPRVVKLTRRPGTPLPADDEAAVFGAAGGAVMQLDSVLVPGGLVYANSPTGGTDQFGNPYQSGITFIGLPSQQNVFSVQDPYGNTLAMVDSDGNVAGQTLSANTDIFVGGSSLLTGLLEALPNGVVALGSLDSHLNAPSTPIPTGTETSIFELDVQMTGGRCYRVSLGTLMLNMSAVGRCDIKVHATNDGTTPSTASPNFMLTYADVPFSNHLNLPSPVLTRIFQPASDMLVRMLVTLQPVSSTLSGVSSSPTVQFMGVADSSSFAYSQQDPLVVEDLGPAVGDTSLYIGAGSGGGTGHQSLTGVWKSTHTYSFWPDGSVRNTDGSCYQGQYSGGNGSQFSFIRFPATAQSTLFAAGVVINAIKLTGTNQHSWYSSGATAILGVSNRTITPPNSNPKISFPSGGDTPALNVQDWNEGVTHTVILPVTFLNNWGVNGTYVLLGNNQWTNLQYYGYWAGGPGSWTLTVDYTT